MSRNDTVSEIRVSTKSTRRVSEASNFVRSWTRESSRELFRWEKEVSHFSERGSVFAVKPKDRKEIDQNCLPLAPYRWGAWPCENAFFIRPYFCFLPFAADKKLEIISKKGFQLSDRGGSEHVVLGDFSDVRRPTEKYHSFRASTNLWRLIWIRRINISDAMAGSATMVRVKFCCGVLVFVVVVKLLCFSKVLMTYFLHFGCFLFVHWTAAQSYQEEPMFILTTPSPIIMSAAEYNSACSCKLLSQHNHSLPLPEYPLATVFLAHVGEPV